MKSKKINLSQIIFILLTIACMALIFFFSSENAEESNDTSSGFTEIAIDIFVPGYDTKPVSEQTRIKNVVTRVVRKCAHFTIYAVLGFCCAMSMGKRRLLSRKNLSAQGISSFYACTDEFHQKFSSGRSGQITDVLLDSAGALTGILFAALVILVLNRLMCRKNS